VLVSGSKNRNVAMMADHASTPRTAFMGFDSQKLI
jgi:hypothetical protein